MQGMVGASRIVISRFVFGTAFFVPRFRFIRRPLSFGMECARVRGHDMGRDTYSVECRRDDMARCAER